MTQGLDPHLHQQLLDAREQIRNQLDAMADRLLPRFRRGGGPPDFDPVVAELKRQLAEIEELLGRGGSSQD